MAKKYDGIADSGGYIMGVSGSHNNAPTDINPFTGKAYPKDGYSSKQLNANGTSMQTNGFDQAAYMKQMQDQVNAIYDQQKQAQLGQLNASRDKAVGRINQQKAEVAPQYQSARNQSDVVNAQNVQRLREMMASSGLQSSGENVTASTGLQNARQNSLNGLNLQEQQTINDFNRQIADLNDPASEQALIASLEAQRAQALFDSSMRADEIGYSRGRDAIGDSRYNTEWQYNTGRDAINDGRYQEETTYNRGQDTKQWDYQTGRDKVGDSQWQSTFDYGKTRDQVGDSQWQQTFNYNKQQDAINNARKSSSGGASRSSSGGGGSRSFSPAAQNLAKEFQNFQKSANNQVDTFEDRYYKPKYDAIDKMIPIVSKSNQKAKQGIKAPTYYDRALDLFR